MTPAERLYRFATQRGSCFLTLFELGWMMPVRITYVGRRRRGRL